MGGWEKTGKGVLSLLSDRNHRTVRVSGSSEENRVSTECSKREDLIQEMMQILETLEANKEHSSKPRATKSRKPVPQGCENKGEKTGLLDGSLEEKANPTMLGPPHLFWSNFLLMLDI